MSPTPFPRLTRRTSPRLALPPTRLPRARLPLLTRTVLLTRAFPSTPARLSLGPLQLREVTA